MDLPVTIDPMPVEYLTEISAHDSFITSYPLTHHIRMRLESRGDRQWVQAVASRENLPLSPEDVADALRLERPPGSTSMRSPSYVPSARSAR